MSPCAVPNAALAGLSAGLAGLSAGLAVCAVRLCVPELASRPPVSGLTSSAASEERASEQRRREDTGSQAASRPSEPASEGRGHSAQNSLVEALSHGQFAPEVA